MQRQNVLPLDSVSRRPDFDRLRDAAFRVARPLGRFDRNAAPDESAFPIAFRRLPGKVLFPIKGLTKVKAGNHGVDHKLATESAPGELLIRHFPVGTFASFHRRLDHWAERFRQDPGRGGSWHLRRWLRLREEGQIEKEYESFAVPVADLDRFLAEGTVVEDDFGKRLG